MLKRLLSALLLIGFIPGLPACRANADTHRLAAGEFYFGTKIKAVTNADQPPPQYYSEADEKSSEYTRKVLGYIWQISERMFFFAGAGFDVSRQIWSEWKEGHITHPDDSRNYIVPSIEFGFGVMF